MGKEADSAYDAVIIGGGHNGLVAAFYLARAGKSVLVLERSEKVGGAAVTEEFHPGYQNSVASYTVSLLNPKVIADMGLHKHGLRIVERRMANFWPLPDDNHLLFHNDPAATVKEIARFSEKDAANYPDYAAMIERVADTLRSLVTVTPPDAGGGLSSWLNTLKVAGRLRGLSESHLEEVLRLFSDSAEDVLSDYFENDIVKGAFAFDSIVGSFTSPYHPGSAYVLLHHMFGEVNGKKGTWGHAIGGMGAITQAMAKAALKAGAEIQTKKTVKEVLAEKDRVMGVELEDGGMIRARAILSNANPVHLLKDLIPAKALPGGVPERVEKYRAESATFRMNVALKALPSFTALPGEGDHLTAGIIIGPGMEYLHQAYESARLDDWSEKPIIEMVIPSSLDPTLAPEGHHVASLFCQHFRYDLSGGWEQAREKAADHILDTVERFAPDFRASIVGRQILSPVDLEARFGLPRGDIFHGRLSLGQMFSARPFVGMGDYRMPVRGLYLCGAGAHPGGGVTGVPGMNAAREVLNDFRFRRV